MYVDAQAPGNRGPDRHLPQPALREESLLQASGRYSNYLGMCWPGAADTQEFRNLFCLKAPVLHLPPPCLVTVCDWASGTMLVGMAILMYNNHLLRTFTWHISLSRDKIQSRLSIKQVPLSLAKSCLGYLKQPT